MKHADMPPYNPRYPRSDGKRRADDTKHFELILDLHVAFVQIFSGRDHVFCANDLLWYPVQGKPRVRIGPDGMVAFGRPMGDRWSYNQWEEAGIPPQVIFEFITPDNRIVEVPEKFDFYNRYGVEEYYTYDYEAHEIATYWREDGRLRRRPESAAIESPRLGVRLRVYRHEFRYYWPCGERLLTAREFQDRASRRKQ